jgi:RNA polymerase sigma factor for flagellar operon FliA
VALWEAFQSDATPEARTRLVEYYLGWARLVARDVFLAIGNPAMEWGDFVHYATIGLLQSIDRYDPGGEARFTTFARYRVRGAVLNGVSKFSEASAQYEHARKLARDRVESLVEARGGDPLADVTELSVGLALGHFLEAESLPGHDTGESGVQQLAESREMEERLQEALADLPERERQILQLHYFQHLTFIEIARQFNLTKGRISQLHRRALQRLHAGMADQAGLDGEY